MLQKQSLILFLFLYFQYSSSTLCPWEYEGLEKWSDPKTWEGVPPINGQNIKINKKILLDTITPDLSKVDISEGGMLIFSPNHDAKLIANFVHILENGHLIIGNPDCVHEGNAEIELTGDKEGPDGTFGYFIKGIYVDVGGNLDLHGQEKLSWTKLSKTVDKTDGMELQLELMDEPFGWKSGDKVVIASTDYDMNQAMQHSLFGTHTPISLF